MKAPEKKEFGISPIGKPTMCKEDIGYNKAIDDMHKWINEAPIKNTIKTMMGLSEDEIKEGQEVSIDLVMITDALRKMLKGEK